MSVCIVGAGLAGTMMAAMLNKLGFQVHVYEKRPQSGIEKSAEEFGLSQSASKRSINLALSQRGIEALAAVDLLDAAMENAIPMPCRVIHQIGSATSLKQPYGKSHEAIHSVSRQLLNELLLMKTKNVPKSRVEYFFGYSLVSCDKAGNCVFHQAESSTDNADGAMVRKNGNGVAPAPAAHVAGEDICRRYDLVIGSDGAYSQVRESMLRLGRVNFSRTYIAHGYKELCIPPRMVESTDPSSGARVLTPTFALDDHQGLHIWPRGEFMLIALPNPDKSFTATLFAPYSGSDGFDSVDDTDPAAVRGYFLRHFPDALPLMPDIAEDFRANPIGSLVTVRVDPWMQGPMVLVGDAAHAVVPFYGQGMNAAFEDCLILYQLIQKRLVAGSAEAKSCGSAGGQRPAEGSQQALQALLLSAADEFARTRMPAGNALADLCIEHYADMASNTASTWYLMQKRMEALLHWAFPASFVPLYTMIAFTRTPYHEAMRIAARQEGIARMALGAVAAASAVGIGLGLWARSRYKL